MWFDVGIQIETLITTLPGSVKTRINWGRNLAFLIALMHEEEQFENSKFERNWKSCLPVPI